VPAGGVELVLHVERPKAGLLHQQMLLGEAEPAGVHRGAVAGGPGDQGPGNLEVPFFALEIPHILTETIKSQSLEIFLDEQYQKLVAQLRELFPEEEVRVFIREVKDYCKERIKEKEETMKKKLCSLRERFKTGRLPPGWRTGSRKIKAFHYIREHSGALPGARFPNNLRPHGRDRPHRNRYPEKSQHHVTEAELAARVPIILTKNPNFELPACGKELMRLGPKTCPTPAGPTDEKALDKAYVQFRETIRWKWYHNKNVKPEANLGMKGQTGWLHLPMTALNWRPFYLHFIEICLIQPSGRKLAEI